MSALADDDLEERYESLYARDWEGRLIRTDTPSLQDLERKICLKIDGEPVEVMQATAATDDQGAIRRDRHGLAIPRPTTILDASVKLFGSRQAPAPEGQLHRNPVPILCHQDHLKPVAVCRVCSVFTIKDKRRAPRLVPACQHVVRANMEVHTMRSAKHGARVRQAVRLLVELMASNHLHFDQPAGQRRYRNELLALADELGIHATAQSQRPVLAPERGRQPVPLETRFSRKSYDPGLLDECSSPIIDVDLNNCILCDRCVRACSEVKPFKVIGHSSRGHRTRISFDLDKPMGKSECKACGECAVSCPTGALAFKGTVYQDRDPWADQPADHRPQTIPADTLAQMPLFSGIPYAFLKWNEGAVGRLECADQHVLCRRGEYGSTAFVIEGGAFTVEFGPGQQDHVLERLDTDIIVGEMACMTHQPRLATLRSRCASSVLVIRRNMLHMLRRNPIARKLLEDGYRSRALETCLLTGSLFDGLSHELGERCVAHLKAASQDDVTFLTADPGELIVREGQPADSFFVINSGHVQVSERRIGRKEGVRDYLGPGLHFGEIAVMSLLSERVANVLPPDERGLRAGTCRALDHVELLRIGQTAFSGLLQLDTAVRDHFERACLDIVEKNTRARKEIGGRLSAFTRQGLYEGQNLLVIDLHKCTRCQECVKACAQAHQNTTAADRPAGVTRLVLEGERFGEYLIPSACRSCHDPLCLIGCPVDAIHRLPADPDRPGRRPLAIRIEDHCIGCGLCEQNCPFGSIHMVERPGGKKHAEPQRMATNCDLCESLDSKPRCVYACPHDAAHRMTGWAFARRLGIDAMGSVNDNLS